MSLIKTRDFETYPGVRVLFFFNYLKMLAVAILYHLHLMHRH